MYQSHHSNHNPRFALACVAVLLVGIVLRLQPWRVNDAQAGQPAVPPATAAESSLPADLAPVVLGFYDKVDRGLYGEAYDISLENKWTRLPDGSYQYAGVTPKQEFVDSLTAEFGANGISLRLDAIQILDAAPLPLPGSPGIDPPEYAVLAHLPPGSRLTGLYQVHVAGSLGDSCTPWPWHKSVIVAGFGDGRLKVLLSGGPRPGNAHRNEWFTDDDPFAGSQLSDTEASN